MVTIESSNCSSRKKKYVLYTCVKIKANGIIILFKQNFKNGLASVAKKRNSEENII